MGNLEEDGEGKCERSLSSPTDMLSLNGQYSIMGRMLDVSSKYILFIYIYLFICCVGGGGVKVTYEGNVRKRGGKGLRREIYGEGDG